MGQWRTAQTGLQEHPRIATAVPVRISTVDAEVDPTTGKTFFRTAEETTANLSRGGAYVRSWEPLEAGRRVVLTLELANHEELQIVGRVVWTRRELRPAAAGEIEQPGYGVEFTPSSRGETERLERHLASLRPPSRSVPLGEPRSPAPRT